MKNIIINKIQAAKVVVIIRSDDSDSVRNSIESLVAAGVTALEVTSNTADFCAHISWARNKFPEILVGAGTIISVELAKQALEAGAQFLVTPNMNVDVIHVAKQANVVTLMGAATPTEVAVGVNHGADFIKIFPAGPLGLDYFKALFGPFKGARFIAVGSINATNIANWFAAGAMAVGVGGSYASGSAETIKSNISQLFAQIK